MANRICRVVTDVPDYTVFNIVVPTGKTYYAGDVLQLDGLMTGSLNVFDVAEPATANLATQKIILINDTFETLSDGRRPDGQANYAKYEFKEGEIVTGILLVEGMRFEISTDSIASGTPTVGYSIHPTNGAVQMTTAATTPAGTYSAFETLALRSFRAGGQFGGEFIPTVVAIVKQPTLVAVV